LTERKQASRPLCSPYLDWRIILRFEFGFKLGSKIVQTWVSNYSSVLVPVQFGLRNLSKSRTLAFETKKQFKFLFFLGAGTCEFFFGLLKKKG
jgi:hypothetical protein